MTPDTIMWWLIAAATLKWVAEVLTILLKSL
jgi:hypothetical protein